MNAAKRKETQENAKERETTGINAMERDKTGKDWKKRDLQKLQALTNQSNPKRAVQVLSSFQGKFSPVVKGRSESYWVV
jgi:hypothetical protein